MPFEMSTVALIVGALGFYFQLISAYRRKMRAWKSEEGRLANRKKNKKLVTGAPVKPTFGSFSKKPLDWVIGAVGYLMIMFGVLVYVNWITIANIKTVWWAPVAVGIILFSWFFH